MEEIIKIAKAHNGVGWAAADAVCPEDGVIPHLLYNLMPGADNSGVTTYGTELEARVSFARAAWFWRACSGWFNRLVEKLYPGASAATLDFHQALHVTQQFIKEWNT